MERVLEIRSIPISLEYKINRAQYNADSDNASMKITRDQGGLRIRSKPIRLKLDTIEARYSAGIKSVMRSVEDFAKAGIKAGYEATANYVQEGNQMSDIHISTNAIPEIALQKFISDVEFNLAFIPGRGPEISWDPQELSIKYDVDKLNFDWKINKPRISFVPGNIEFMIKQYPKVEIKYVGDPMFVPPSADPNYTPIDAMA